VRNTLASKINRLVAVAMVATLVAGLAPASALAKSKDPLDRKQVIKRAKSWTSKRVPYSQAGYRGGYRRDCSGFVSMAWDLPENLVTWRIPYVTKRIAKSQLKPGDVLLDYKSGSKHVVMFEKWANKKKTRFFVLESTGQNGVDRAVRRVVPYPYRINKSYYKPYRYVGMDRYWKHIPRKLRQPVRGYDGPILSPYQREQIAKQKAAEKREAAEKKARIARKAAEKKADEARARAAAEARVAAERAAAEKLEAERRGTPTERRADPIRAVFAGFAASLVR